MISEARSKLFGFVFCFVAGLLAATFGNSWISAKGEATPDSLDRQRQRLLSGRHALSEASDLLARVAALTIPSVVHIQSVQRSKYGGQIEETGSGVIVRSKVSEGFFIVTNRHVIAQNDHNSPKALQNISIHLYDGRILHPLRVWTDPASDVAVMKIAAQDVHPARWGNSDAVRIGEMVLAVGSPFGLSHSVTFGIISAKGRRSLQLGEQEAGQLVNQDFLQTDAAINPGNSGGPLINLNGQVIGINTAIASNGGGNEGIGFSIPSNLVRWVVSQLLAHGEVQRAYLGVTLDPDFNEKKAALLHLDRPRGAFVQEVHPNTPASRANIKPGDVILSFDGIDVQDENHLINLVSLSPIGKRVQLVIWRDGRKMTIEVTLAPRHLEQESMLQRRRQRLLPTRPGSGMYIKPMGLQVTKLTPALAVQLGYKPSQQGLLVLKVSPNSPLRCSVSIQDVVERVGSLSLETPEQLLKVIMQQPSQQLVLKVVHPAGRGASEELVVWQPSQAKMLASKKTPQRI